MTFFFKEKKILKIFRKTDVTWQASKRKKVFCTKHFFDNNNGEKQHKKKRDLLMMIHTHTDRDQFSKFDPGFYFQQKV